MKILYLTWGESISLAGVYRAQALDIISALKGLSPDVELALYAGVPIINRALVEERFGYFSYLKKIREFLESKNILCKISHLCVPPKSFYSIAVERGFYTLFPHMNSLSKFIKEFNPDIIHCRSYWATYLAQLVKKKTNSSFKIIFDTRGNFPEEAVLKRSRLFRKNDYLYWSNIEKKLITDSDAVVCVSKGMGENYRRKHNLTPTINYIYTNADIAIFYPKISKLLAKKNLNIEENTFVVGYSGALGKNEWHVSESLLAVFNVVKKEWKNAKLLIVTRSSHQEIVFLFEKYFSPSDLLIFSANSKEEVAKYLSAMDVATLCYRPIVNEYDIILANSILASKTGEYLAAGLPVIVNNSLGGASKVIQETNTGVLYDLGNEQKIIPALRMLLGDPDLPQRCINEAKNNFDLVGNAKRYLRLYQRIFT